MRKHLQYLINLICDDTIIKIQDIRMDKKYSSSYAIIKQIKIEIDETEKLIAQLENPVRAVITNE